MFERSKALKWLDLYLRYVNYLGAAQLYLKSNCLLRQELQQNDIKDRILGHWGTVPGLNFIYAHLNYLVQKHNLNMMFIAGPGHGAPGVIANLFAEASLHEYYPDLKLDEKGTSALIKMFSWPGGFPSHTNPGTPGAILEGGELGYCLSTAFGAVLDNPDLIVACVVGDGEAESGPLAASWHSNKFLNPAESGAVLPILHINGYKITGPTIYGTMSDDELHQYFTGLGYEPILVDVTDLNKKNHHEKMISALEKAYGMIRKIQKKARGSSEPYLKPQWPMILFRSIKGWSGIKTLHGKKVEGTYHAHGIPAGHPKTDPEEFKKVRDWLMSYNFTELVDEKGRPKPEVMRFVPQGKSRMGMNKHALGGNIRKPLKLPALAKYEVKCSKEYCEIDVSNTAIGAKYIRDIFKLNAKNKNFRFMCPDETESNKLTALFEVTKRAFMWPVKSYDENLAVDGRVMEVLNEHSLQGWLEGYLLTGRHGMFATYEAFATIVASMVDQYAKFLKQSSHVKWRKPISSLNYLLTSVGWRQEHNGYSHQNPSFISNLVEKHGAFCSVYFPVDANSMLVILEDCFKRTDSINVIVSGKQPMPQWLTLKEAREELKLGIGRWDWINPSHAANPDIVMAAAGDVPVQESMAAIWWLRKLCPELKIRFVNVSEISALGIGDERHPLALEDKHFHHYFTTDKHVIFNFHGYPSVIQKLMFGHGALARFCIRGYIEEGTTTTPFDMVVRNKTSRFHLAIQAVKHASEANPSVAKKANKLIKFFEQQLKEHSRYILIHGTDMPEIEKWKWENV
ncbi:MAG: phosphoketolase family protein [Candidatus Peregrinibacteria bacterium]|nr:phosphoketolase family protein [Candidatus Peregrinibacteria bacterium]